MSPANASRGTAPFVILSAKTSMEKTRNSFVMLPVLCTTVLMAGYLSTITCAMRRR
eukprot:CAMPEP_0173128636 /NCGR_PEP_ID=MMETSP1102-20130122/58664_1 /TAXON_ID=49646 /ORGANISM="Geminigera sp., Strain Caron Lab Isolate" /LENGTH=55 /DNA_ID=CAMNT_0014038801 /DNA_START=114 /DNA_END=281 /DNA_ORIENTATION=-